MPLYNIMVFERLTDSLSWGWFTKEDSVITNLVLLVAKLRSKRASIDRKPSISLSSSAPSTPARSLGFWSARH